MYQPRNIAGRHVWPVLRRIGYCQTPPWSLYSPYSNPRRWPPPVPMFVRVLHIGGCRRRVGSGCTRHRRCSVGDAFLCLQKPTLNPILLPATQFSAIHTLIHTCHWCSPWLWRVHRLCHFLLWLWLICFLYSTFRLPNVSSSPL